jgi:hypothetical protein
MSDKSVNNGFWENPLIWSEGTSPATTEVAEIASLVGVDANETVAGVMVDSGGMLTLSNATLTSAAGFTNNGSIGGVGVVVGDVVGPGSIMANGGTLEIKGAVDVTSAQPMLLTIAQASTLALDGAVGSQASVIFEGTPATLDLTGEGFKSNDFAATVSGFGAGDQIVVSSTDTGDQLKFSNDVLTVETSGGGVLEQIQLSGAYSADDFAFAHSGDTDVISDSAACFVRGTRILTERGGVPIEELKLGDLVVTRFGQSRAIKWIGRREVNCSAHPNPELVWPICVSRDAFGENQPARDLWLSPGHNIFSEGVIIPIEAVVNDKTVVQHRLETVEYWHLELDAHDIILSEGLPSESYLDTGNRRAFANGGGFVELHPDFRPNHWSDTCVPLKKEGEEINRTKTALLARAEALGHAVTSESNLHVVADGRRLEPMKFGGTQFAFVLPCDARDIKLVSRTFVPAHMVTDSTDHRRLGVCVTRLRIDAEDVPLDHESLSSDGWNELERDGDHARRWTAGVATIPRKGGLMVVEISEQGSYWSESDDDGARLRA